MPVNPNNIIRVATRLEDSFQNDFVNVFLYRYDEIVASSDDVVMDKLDTQMELMFTPLLSILSGTASFIDINYFNVTQDRPMEIRPWPTLISGQAAGDPLPGQIAGLVTMKTAFSRVVARKFIGPLVEGLNTGEGLATASTMTQLGLFAAQWLTLTATPVLTPGIIRSQTSIFAPITEAVIRNVWSTLRRRRHLRGS